MYTTIRRRSVDALFVMLAGLAAWSTPALAQVESGSRWWLGAGLGGAAVDSLAPAPSADRRGLAASVEFGYRLTPQLGLGLEFGAVAPLGGCADWGCGDSATSFAPNFTRIHAFGEFRPPDSGWRFRAGAGVSRFCYRRHWSASAWGWGDTLGVALAAILDDEPDVYSSDGSGAYSCDGRMKALGGTLSVGYDWPVSVHAPVSVGLRLSAEAANFGATPAIDLPAFRHRAVMLTLHLNIN